MKEAWKLFKKVSIIFLTVAFWSLVIEFVTIYLFSNSHRGPVGIMKTVIM